MSLENSTNNLKELYQSVCGVRKSKKKLSPPLYLLLLSTEHIVHVHRAWLDCIDIIFILQKSMKNHGKVSRKNCIFQKNPIFFLKMGE